ncbi:hypothetical protein Rhopal_004133-T1 [Rhodotorula paludigena]|uniref:Transcription factor domain-containing protein n=1 Tax=Rhodotorula paludigena TaxID=86838 RepID=A0AAV5GF03_9BASI|nr:hypothetical protein Rhopal_004133-T1 [Rhodotorula paludigena]
MANEGPRRPEKVFEDIVVAGIIPEEQVEGLFQFYFAHLNPMTSLLDPDLHTVEFCRSRSAFLFTAILTVASKVAHPTLYPPSLKYAKSLLGQAFEAGTNTLELVQALATLVFWQDPTDDSGARKLAYAIRCAYELNIHKYLTIADHRFSTQRGLPKMINNDFRSDAIPWLLEHKSEQLCPQSAGLAPLIELGRASLVRFYGTVLQFQLLEINLYLAIRRTTNSLDSFGFDPRTDARSSPLVVFSNCIKSAIKVLDVMERELRFMVYSFDSRPTGTPSLAALTRLQTACSDISNGPQSMAAYTSRLLQHLLIKVQVAESTAAAAAASANQQVPEASSSGATASGLPAAPAAAGNPLGATPSYVKASLSAPSWSTDPGSSGTAANGYSVFNSGGFSGGTFTPPQPPQAGMGQRVQAQQPMWDDNGGRGAGGAPNADTMAAAASGADQGFDALNANFLASMMPPMQSFDEDLPFPAGDDAFWQSLFPLSFEAP